jgi:hypothetical protein
MPTLGCDAEGEFGIEGSERETDSEICGDGKERHT